MRKKILLIDDEPEFCEMLGLRLEAQGYRVEVAHNGTDGQELARTKQPNLILLDVNMPGIDGLKTLALLNKDKDTRNIPVVMLTCIGDTKTIFKAQDAGATDYVIKPCTNPDFLRLVERYIGPC